MEGFQHRPIVAATCITANFYLFMGPMQTLRSRCLHRYIPSIIPITARARSQGTGHADLLCEGLSSCSLLCQGTGHVYTFQDTQHMALSGYPRPSRLEAQNHVVVIQLSYSSPEP